MTMGRIGPAALRLGPIAVPVARRSVLACVGLVALGAAATVFAVLYGEIQMSMPRLLATVAGDGTSFEDYLVFDSRLPRVVSGLVLGAALGMSGAIFQTVSRNPLGSPDVIGFETGAASGGLVALLVVGSGFAGASVGAIIGGLLTALVVYALALRNGLDGLRLVLIGMPMATRPWYASTSPRSSSPFAATTVLATPRRTATITVPVHPSAPVIPAAAKTSVSTSSPRAR